MPCFEDTLGKQFCHFFLSFVFSRELCSSYCVSMQTAGQDRALSASPPQKSSSGAQETNVMLTCRKSGDMGDPRASQGGRVELVGHFFFVAFFSVSVSVCSCVSVVAIHSDLDTERRKKETRGRDKHTDIREYRWPTERYTLGICPHMWTRRNW